MVIAAMDITSLPFRASLGEYQKLTEQLLEAWKAGDGAAIQIVRQRHPRLLDPSIPWLPKSEF